MASTPSAISFQGLRPLNRGDGCFPKKVMTPATTRTRNASTGAWDRLVVKVEPNTQLVISLSNGLSLFLGRFVLFNFQRENVAKQGLPEQNGKTHFEAGDTRAKEYVSLLKSSDPVGFNIVDVLA
ncbi:hypothetical protein SLA2020_015040 [Shorea laevis]